MKKILAILLMVFIGVGFLSAQKATPYQKKRLEIIRKYARNGQVLDVKNRKIIRRKPTQKEIAEWESISSSSDKRYPVDSYMWMEEKIKSYLHIINNLNLLKDDQWKTLRQELQTTIKLKNSTDRKIELWKTDGTMGLIVRSVNELLLNWQKKGEFEKTDDYQTRIKEKSKDEFVLICNSIISFYISKYLFNLSSYLGKYNPDGEYYEIKIFDGVENWYLQPVPMSVQKAQTLKTTLKLACEQNRYWTKDYGGDLEFFLVIPRNPDNFSCVNYHIYPQKINFYNLDFEDLFSITDKHSDAGEYREYRLKYKTGSHTDHFDNDSLQSYYDFSLQNYYNGNYTGKIIVYDTCVVYDGPDYFMFPRISPYTEGESFKMKIGVNKKRYELPWCVREKINSNMAIEDIVVYFDDLKINNPYLKGCAFNYTKQKFITASGIESDVSGALSGITSPENAISSLSQAIYTYKTHVLQYGYDTSDYKLELAIPNEVKDNPQKIMDVANSLLDSVRIRERELLELHIADSTMFAKYGDSLQQAVNQAKTELSEFPYNINKLTLEGDYALSRSNFGNEAALKEELRNKTTEIQEKTVVLKSLIVKELRTNSPEKYLQIWFKHNPGKRAEAEKLWPECRCKYAGEQDFQLAFTDDTVSDCGCRADLYDKYGNLFKNKHEFDKYYDKGQSEINHEIEERTAVKKELLAFETYMKTAKQVKLKEALTSKKDAVQLVVSKLQYFKNNYFYEEAVQILFTYNEKLAKEWKENGQYFESQVEMYEAYIGEEYKAILKGKKQ